MAANARLDQVKIDGQVAFAFATYEDSHITRLTVKGFVFDLNKKELRELKDAIDAHYDTNTGEAW